MAHPLDDKGMPLAKDAYVTDPIATLRGATEPFLRDTWSDTRASVLAALAELERRARIEARRDAFAKGKDGFEAAWRPGAERMTLRWTTEWETHEGAFFGHTPHAFSGDSPDYHTALEAALNAAGAP